MLYLPRPDTGSRIRESRAKSNHDSSLVDGATPDPNALTASTDAQDEAQTDPPARPSRKCTVTLDVRSESGASTEGLLVQFAGESDLTRHDGRVSFPAVIAGREYELVVTDDFRERARRMVTIPSGVNTHAVTVKLPEELQSVLLVRLRTTEPRRGEVRLTLERPSMKTSLSLRPGLDVWRFVLPFGSLAKVRAMGGGYSPVVRSVRLPSEPGVTVLDIELQSSGVGAYGLVLDENGYPASDVEVFAYDDRHPAKELHRVRTNADGLFLWKAEFFDASWIARRQGVSCSPWIEPLTLTSRGVLQLQPGGLVEGTVRDETVRTVPGAHVAVRIGANEDLRSWGALETTQADELGDYRLSGLPEGWWVCPFVPRGDSQKPANGAEDPLSAGSSGNELVDAARAHVIVTSGDVFRRDLKLVAVPMSTVVLRVAANHLAHIPPELRIGSGGADHARWSRSMALDPDRPEVRIPIAPGVGRFVTVRGAGVHGVSERFAIAAGEERSVEITLQSMPRVTLQLVEEDGQPLRRSGVTFICSPVVRQPVNRPVELISDAAGRADATDAIAAVDEWFDGTRLTVRLRGGGVAYAHPRDGKGGLQLAGPDFAERLRAGDEVVLPVVLLPPRQVQLTVVDADGVALAGVRVALSPAELFHPKERTTDQNGQCLVSVLHDEAVSIWWNKARIEALPRYSGSLTFESSALRRAAEWTLVVHPLTAYDVVVRDAEGRPLPGVSLVGSHGTRTDRDGRTVVHGQPGHRVSGWSPSHHLQDVFLPDGNERPVIVLARRLRHVEVEIRFRAEIPSETRMTVSANPIVVGEAATPGRQISVARKRGRTVASMSLTSDRFRIVVRSLDNVWFGEVDLAADASRCVVHLGRGPSVAVRFRLQTEAGDALPGREVRLRCRKYPWLRAVTRTSDASGAFEMTLPIARHLGLTYALDSEAGRYISIRVPAEEPIVLTIAK